MKNIILLMILSAFSFSSIQNLDLEKALEMLKNNNTKLKIDKLQSLIKEYDVSIINASHFGKMDISLDVLKSNAPLNAFAFKLQNKKITQNDFSPNNLNNPQERTNYKIRISYQLPLYAGGRTMNYRNIAKSMYHISKLNQKDALNKKILETKRVFYNISLIEKYISSLSTILENIKRLQKATKFMKKEGYAKHTDLLEIKARISKVDSMYKHGLLEKRLAYQFLSFLLDEEIKSIKKINKVSKLNSNSNYNIENTIQVQKAKYGLDIQKSIQSVEFANFLPSVGFFAVYDMENEKLSDFEDSHTIGIKISSNIFNGGSDMMKYQQYKLKTIQSQEKLKLSQKMLYLKINKLNSQISQSKNNVKSLQDRLKLLKEIYKTYKAKYKEGLVSINDVLIKQSKEIEVIIQLLKARSIYNASILELNYIKNEDNK